MRGPAKPVFSTTPMRTSSVPASDDRVQALAIGLAEWVLREECAVWPPHPTLRATFSPLGRRGDAATSPFPSYPSRGMSPLPVFTGGPKDGSGRVARTRHPVLEQSPSDPSLAVVHDAHDITPARDTDEEIVPVSPCPDQISLTDVLHISDAITTPFEEANRIVWPEVVPIRAPSASLVVVAVPPLQKIRFRLAIVRISKELRSLAFLDDHLRTSRHRKRHCQRHSHCQGSNSHFHRPTLSITRLMNICRVSGGPTYGHFRFLLCAF